MAKPAGRAPVPVDEQVTPTRLGNLGRQPLAASMGLTLPETNDGERAMWTLTAEFARGPHTPEMTALDRYRSRDNALTAEAGAIETGAMPSGRAADADNGPVPGEHLFIWRSPSSPG